AGGLVGEGHRQDAARLDAVLDEAGDARDQDAGLAAAGAGEDHERPVAVHHGLALLGVEGLEVRRHLVSDDALPSGPGSIPCFFSSATRRSRSAPASRSRRRISSLFLFRRSISSWSWLRLGSIFAVSDFTKTAWVVSLSGPARYRPASTRSRSRS